MNREDTAEADPLGTAIIRLAASGLVAYPTETVWGLAADSCSDEAMDALRGWKGRSADQPISILVPDFEALEALDFEISPAARRLVRAYWPGPLTLILDCQKRFARGVAREDGAVGVRCSSHPVAEALAGFSLEAGLGPITSTSLNRSGEPPVHDLETALELCSDPKGPLVFRAETGEGGEPSTVLDLTEDEPRILRSGAISSVAIAKTLEES